MKQSTLDKMNESLALSLVSNRAFNVHEKCWKDVTEYTAAHFTAESDKANKDHAHTREEVIEYFIDNTHTKIFKPAKGK